MNLAITMLIIFGSAKLLAELFERLHLPGVVGEILAGILIGPSVLGWISPNEFTLTMAELGVFFLLFQVGLDVDASEMLKVGGTAAAVGILGVVVPFVGGWGLFLLWGKGEVESIFLGAALTATRDQSQHSPLAYTVVSLAACRYPPKAVFHSRKSMVRPSIRGANGPPASATRSA